MNIAFCLGMVVAIAAGWVGILPGLLLMLASSTVTAIRAFLK